MSFPLRLQFLSLPPSDAVTTWVRLHFGSLERFSNRIEGCQVWIEKLMTRRRKNWLYRVHARLTVPGEELVVISQPAEEDVATAIRHTFETTRRELEKSERRRHPKPGAHPHPRARSGKARAARNGQRMTNG